MKFWNPINRWSWRKIRSGIGLGGNFGGGARDVYFVRVIVIGIGWIIKDLGNWQYHNIYQILQAGMFSRWPQRPEKLQIELIETLQLQKLPDL